MTTAFTDPRAARFRHAPNERLRAADLQGEAEASAWLRALHVVGLHDTWGIALGLDVPGGRMAIDEELTVRPGLAYDAKGRPMWLGSKRVVPSPALVYPGEQGPSFDLVMTFASGTEVRPQTRDDGLCLLCDDPGAGPALAWRRPGAVRLGWECPLIRWTVAEDETAILDPSIRRYATSRARAHVGAGSTPPEQIWEFWPATGLDGGVPFPSGLQTRVDARPAGFASTPTYEATLTIADASGPGFGAFEADLKRLRQPLLAHVAEPSPDGFLLRIPYTAPLARRELYSAPLPGPWPIGVSWIGVEPNGGLAPSDGDFGGKPSRRCDDASTPDGGPAR